MIISQPKRRDSRKGHDIIRRVIAICTDELYPKNFSRQDAKIPRFYPVVLARGLTILLKLLTVTPNDAEANTLTVFDEVMTEIER